MGDTRSPWRDCETVAVRLDDVRIAWDLLIWTRSNRTLGAIISFCRCGQPCMVLRGNRTGTLALVYVKTLWKEGKWGQTRARRFPREDSLN